MDGACGPAPCKAELAARCGRHMLACSGINADPLRVTAQLNLQSAVPGRQAARKPHAGHSGCACRVYVGQQVAAQFALHRRHARAGGG